jgi:hypothetical protein
MVSVANMAPRVQHPRLAVVAGAGGWPRLFLEYSYSFRPPIVGEPDIRQDITRLVAPPDGNKLLMLALAGVTPDGTAAELDDVNAGMITLMGLWHARCGMKASWVTL